MRVRQVSLRAWRLRDYGRLCLAAAATLAVACGGSPAAPSSNDQLTERIETAHFVFRYAPGDQVDPEWQEAYYIWVSAALGVNPARKIEYRKYRDRQHMGRLTGRSSTNGYAEPSSFTIHSIWPRDNHEVVHVYASEWGSPVALFSEGLAVAHSTNPSSGDFRPKWHGTPVHDVARQLRAAGRLIAIAQLGANASFRSFDDNVTYPEAGSFVRFLIDREGIDRMKAVFGRLGVNDSLERVQAGVREVYGMTLQDLEARWLDELGH